MGLPATEVLREEAADGKIAAVERLPWMAERESSNY